MNNDPQQNDLLHEHGWDVRAGLAALTEASLMLIPLRKDAPQVTSAAFYGPFCKFSNTLPYKIPLRIEPNSARWSVTVPDVCYWTPNLPFHYRLTLQLTDTRQLTTWVALKRFGVKGTALSMDGERYVLRGFSTRGLEFTASDDAAWQALREQRAVLVLETLEQELVLRAGWAGIPVLWDTRKQRLQTADILAIRAMPAVMGMLANEPFLREPAFQQAANELLWIVAGADESALRDLADERTQVALLREPSEQMTFSREWPTIISSPFTGNPSLADRRKLCDELQAQTAELGSAAGYLLL